MQPAFVATCKLWSPCDVLAGAVQVMLTYWQHACRCLLKAFQLAAPMRCAGHIACAAVWEVRQWTPAYSSWLLLLLLARNGSMSTACIEVTGAAPPAREEQIHKNKCRSDIP